MRYEFLTNIRRYRARRMDVVSQYLKEAYHIKEIHMTTHNNIFPLNWHRRYMFISITLTTADDNKVSCGNDKDLMTH